MIFNVKTQSAALELWKQERLIAYIEAHSQAEATIKFWSDLHGSQSAPFATYTTQANGKCYIDLTDYMRAFRSVTKLLFYDSSNTTTYEVTCSVVGLINPHGALKPEPVVPETDILPPSLMYKAVSQYGAQIQFEMYGISTSYYWATLHMFTMPGNVEIDKARTVALANSVTALKLLYYNGMVYQTSFIKPLLCDHAYAMVRWVSLSGVTRCHTFEMLKETAESAGNYSLLPIDNEYVTIKGRKDGVTMHIEGLTPYDVWYYADVLTSSKVEVSLDGTNWAQVDVDTKSVTIPEGTSANNKFEFKVNYKRYDAVAM